MKLKDLLATLEHTEIKVAADKAQDDFERGFMDKLAEHGLDKEAFLGRLGNAARNMMRFTPMGAGMGLGMAAATAAGRFFGGGSPQAQQNPAIQTGAFSTDQTNMQPGGTFFQQVRQPSLGTNRYGGNRGIQRKVDNARSRMQSMYKKQGPATGYGNKTVVSPAAQQFGIRQNIQQGPTGQVSNPGQL